MKQIDSQPNWTLAGIYKDEGKYQNERNRMIEDCKAGKIDLVIAKSCSRLSRNLEEVLRMIKTLKELDPPVGIWFYNENMYTLDLNSDLVLKLLSELADEESRRKSEYMGRHIR